MRPATILCALGLLSGCAWLPGPAPAGTAPLRGRIDFGTGYTTAATMGEVANAATVSLIDVTSGETKASTVTQPNGDFILSFGVDFVPQATPYYLEAVKGLSVGGAANRAGAATARIRTMIRFANGWSSLTGGGVSVTRTTTALCVLSSLNQLSPTQNLGLIGSLTLGTRDTSASPETPDTFSGGSGGITNADFHKAFLLVDNALTLNQDPVWGLARDASSGQLFRRISGFVASRVVPATAAKGTTIQIKGSGFPIDAALVGVLFGQTLVMASSVSSDGTTVSVVVPDLGAGSVSAPLTVQVETLRHAALPFTYTP